MNEELDLITNSAKGDMQEAIVHLEKQLVNIRAGKASPAMLSAVMVEYYGTKTPLNQVSNINTPDSRTLSIQPFEKSLIPEIEEGIQNANLGFNPMNNGDNVIINVPPLTEERRKELAKQAKSLVEDAKVAVRNDRKNANDEIKKLNLSEDLQKNAEIDIQELTDSYIKRIDEIFAVKEKEIMTV
jgi:ribosome recycling factor